MIRLGFIGAQSAHTRIFGQLVNIESRYSDICVGAIWGGDDTAAEEEIATILKVPVAASVEELIDTTDAAVILLRDGNSHLHWAQYALTKGKPLFIDKPFTDDPADAYEITTFAKRLHIPVFGGSSLRHLPIIEDIKYRLKHGHYHTMEIRFSADPESPFGGYHFYGCHLADLSTALLGSQYSSVKISQQGKAVTAHVIYDGFESQLMSTPDTDGLSITLLGEDSVSYEIPYDSCYGFAFDKFATMLRSGDPPIAYDELIATVSLTSDIASKLNTL